MERKIFYLTKEKLEAIKREHAKLVSFEHQKVLVEEAPKMMESEDVNAEFLSYHEDMESLRNRIEELRNIIEYHQLIKKPSREKQALVDLGARVKIEGNGEKNEFLIVGTLEADPETGKISNESPLGKALLGHRVGDQVMLAFSSNKSYRITSIRYEIS